MPHETVPFSVQCSCGTSTTIRVEKSRLKKGQKIAGECSACQNTLMLVISKDDPEASTISYDIEVKPKKK